MAAGTTPLAHANITRSEVLAGYPSTTARRTNVRLTAQNSHMDVTVDESSTLSLPTVVRQYHYEMNKQKVIPIWQDPVAQKHILYEAQIRSLNRPSTSATLPTKSTQNAVTSSTQSSKSEQVREATAPSPRKLSSRQGVLPQLKGLAGVGAAVVKVALHLVGSAYEFGGDTTQGFDCSGLVQYVYGKVGIVLPRTSYQQFEVGQAIPLRDLQPGDLMFFSTYGSGASHVAIYVGNGQIVQALNSDTGVVMSSLSDAYYRTHFIGARRP